MCIRDRYSGDVLDAPLDLHQRFSGEWHAQKLNLPDKLCLSHAFFQTDAANVFPNGDGGGLFDFRFHGSVSYTHLLVATVTPEAAANRDVTWSSSKPEVATVDQNGKVVAQKPGNATIDVYKRQPLVWPSVRRKWQKKTLSSKISVPWKVWAVYPLSVPIKQVL